MDIRLEPYTFEPSCNCPPDEVGFDKDLHIRDSHIPITYWGVFINEDRVSMTSSRELAEKTKVWIENWLASQQ
jgi:hypothetical protein